MISRSYHLIASASKDSKVRICRMDIVSGRITINEEAAFDDHHSEVWKVEWNVTGTILASSGDDCKVRLWKAIPHTGKWKMFGILSGEDSDE